MFRPTWFEALQGCLGISDLVPAVFRAAQYLAIAGKDELASLEVCGESSLLARGRLDWDFRKRHDLSGFEFAESLVEDVGHTG